MENIGFCCAYVIIFPFFFAAWAIGVHRFRPRFYGLWMAASVPASIVFTIVLLLVIVLSLPDYRSLPGVVFRDSFGFEMPSDVKVVNSSNKPVIDWDERRLDFYADRSTIDRIVKGNSQYVHAKDIREEQNAQWWGPVDDADAEYYAKDVHSQTLPSRYYARDVLIYQPSSKKVYYRGVD